MNAANENKCLPNSNRVGLATRQQRFLVAIALSGLAFLGIRLATGLAVPSGAKTEALVSIDARPQSTLPTDPNHQAIESTDSQAQALNPISSSDDESEVVRDFVMDGLEFAVVGAEVSNQFGPYRQIGNTVSWLTKELSQSEEARLVAIKQPSPAIQVANPLLSSTEKEMATWLLQNSPWAR